MPNTIVTRTFDFSSAHRIAGHPKCGRLHGHNYRLTVFVQGPIGQQGMVIDFADLDEIVEWIVDRLDHRFIYSAQRGDPILVALREDERCALNLYNTTAEELAAWFWEQIQDGLNQWCRDMDALAPLTCCQIKLRETERNEVVYQPTVEASAHVYAHVTERN